MKRRAAAQPKPVYLPFGEILDKTDDPRHTERAAAEGSVDRGHERRGVVREFSGFFAVETGDDQTGSKILGVSGGDIDEHRVPVRHPDVLPALETLGRGPPGRPNHHAADEIPEEREVDDMVPDPVMPTDLSSLADLHMPGALTIVERDRAKRTGPVASNGTAHDRIQARGKEDDAAGFLFTHGT